MTGDIRVDGHPKQQSTFARVCGYVEQNDIHSPQVCMLSFGMRMDSPHVSHISTNATTLSSHVFVACSGPGDGLMSSAEDFEMPWSGDGGGVADVFGAAAAHGSQQDRPAHLRERGLLQI